MPHRKIEARSVHLVAESTSYTVLPTEDRVPDVKAYGHRYHWLAQRHCRQLSRAMQSVTFRWEVRAGDHRGRHRWLVVAMQNRAVPLVKEKRR